MRHVLTRSQGVTMLNQKGNVSSNPRNSVNASFLPSICRASDATVSSMWFAHFNGIDVELPDECVDFFAFARECTVDEVVAVLRRVAVLASCAPPRGAPNIGSSSRH
jgi:hypothetical protein